MNLIKNGEATDLLKNFREIEEKGISALSDEKVTETLFLIKVIKDTIDLYEDGLKEKAVERNLTAIDEKHEYKLLIEEGRASTKIDVEKVFKTLPFHQFLEVVNVVSSKATTDEQKKAIEDASTKQLSEKKVVAVKKLSKADLKKLKA